jgi:hypothetical protein
MPAGRVRSLSRLGLKTVLIGGAGLVALLIGAVMGLGGLWAVRTFTLSETVERYQLLAQGLASEYEQYLALHLNAVRLLAAQAAGVEPLNAATLNPHLARPRQHYPGAPSDERRSYLQRPPGAVWCA